VITDWTRGAETSSRCCAPYPARVRPRGHAVQPGPGRRADSGPAARPCVTSGCGATVTCAAAEAPVTDRGRALRRGARPPVPVEIYARPAARLARTPGRGDDQSTRSARRTFERRRMTGVVRGLYLTPSCSLTATIAVSEVVRTASSAGASRRGRSAVIPNGLDTGSVCPSTRRPGPGPGTVPASRPDTFVIGTLGRLDPNKRVAW